MLTALGRALVTALISAGSLLGFVAFAGSVVLWTRFSAVEVAPDQVVDAVPQGESLAIGSVMLLLFGFFGALAAVVIYLIDRPGRATPGMSRGLLVILAVEAVAAVWIDAEPASSSKVIATEVIVLVFGAALWTTFVGGLIRLDADKLPSGGDRAEKLQEEEDRAFRRSGGRSGVAPVAVIATLLADCAIAAVVLAAFIFLVSPAAGWIAALATLGLLWLLAICRHWLRFELRRTDARPTRRSVPARAWRAVTAPRRWQRFRLWWRRATRVPGPARPPLRRRPRKKPGPPIKAVARPVKGPVEPPKDGEETGRPPGFELTRWGGLVLVSLAAVAIVVPSLILRAWWLAVSLAAIMAIGTGLWRIAGLLKERFLWLGLAVFVSVPLFGTLTLMARNLDDPQVQPVALIRSTDGPDEAIQGLYVTETSERVYFANVATEGCENEVEPDSGRLLWVPSKEVVAMSIGPLQDVDEAGRTALEMAYALTPEVETPAGDHVSLTTAAEERAASTGRGEAAGRLEDPGPAIRPSFGSGLKLVPETASPGRPVELRLAVRNRAVRGFGPKPEGRSVRVGGVPAKLLHEGAHRAGEAEYVKTAIPPPGGAPLPQKRVLLRLDKLGVYGLDDEKSPVLLEDEPGYAGNRYVRLDDERVEEVRGGLLLARYNEYLRVSQDGATLTGDPEVKLEGADGFVPLDGRFRRQSWNNDRIRFRVPGNVSTGLVTVECGQLAGQPLLRVTHAPHARIAVRMRPGSLGVVLDSSLSSDEDEAVDGDSITRRWRIEGIGRGKRARISAVLPPRTGAYSVELTVTDASGNSDTAELQLLRLPAPLFEFNDERPRNRVALAQAREKLAQRIGTQRPAAIELDGHADDPGTPGYNVNLSLRRAVEVRKRLLPEPGDADEAGPAIPVRTLAYGEGCPADPRPGRNRRNRRVDVFVLDDGVTVIPPATCRPRRFHSTVWPAPGGEDAR